MAPMRVHPKYFVPNGFTALSMLFGLASVATSAAAYVDHVAGRPSADQFVLAAWMVCWGVLLDKLDGTSARLMKATSAFGVQFDSFADFVAFGIAPGHAEIWATLRTPADAAMDALRAEAMTLALQVATAHGLGISFTHPDDFAATVNDPQAARILEGALDALAIPHGPGTLPMRASEDFGRFAIPPTKLAMLLLGSGPGPALHNPDYDFNDALIPLGVRLFDRVIADLLS